MLDRSAVEMTPASRHDERNTVRDAVETAVVVAMVAHLLLCFIVVLSMALMSDADSRMLSLMIGAGLAISLPVVVIPAAVSIGMLAHVMFSESAMSVSAMTCLLTLLFEASLLGWMIYLVSLLR